VSNQPGPNNCVSHGVCVHIKKLLTVFSILLPLPSISNPNILLSTLFSNTLSLYPSFDETDQVPHPTLKQPNVNLSFSLLFKHWSEYQNSDSVTYIHIMHPPGLMLSSGTVISVSGLTSTLPAVLTGAPLELVSDICAIPNPPFYVIYIKILYTTKSTVLNTVRIT